MPLDKIVLDLENCYGIKSLSTEFDFSESNVFALYAPNGVMKTSLAHALKDVAEDRESIDRIFPQRTTKRIILDSTGANVEKESILVVSPYDEEIGVTEKTSVLLVNSKLRKEYEDLHSKINESKKRFLAALRKQSKSRGDLEKEISLTFTKQEDQFYRALARVKDEIDPTSDAPLSQVRYDLIFDEKILEFLNTHDFKTAIKDYVTKYNELLDASRYFSRETFNYYNAAVIARSLASNGFFDAKHTVNLNANQTIEVNSRKQLEGLIAEEKEKISSDHMLRTKFAEIEKLLTKNAQFRGFQDYLGNNEFLLPKLANVEVLKEDILKSYFASNHTLYCNLLEEYKVMQKRKGQIEEEARRQRTQWETVIDIFNSRFYVPFKLVLENRERVILGTDQIPRLGFEFHEGGEGQSVDVNRDTLMRTLSTGERKALYVLNIIFEVEARRSTGQETLFVFDDIADSFDYRNKYSIIQYLVDITEEPSFKQLILTHNFDFFRTVESRFVKYSHCFMAEKNSRGLSIVRASGIRNPFVLDWKHAFFDDQMKRIASIPFLRNLIEYTKGTDDPNYATLTSLLHWKSQSSTVRQQHLDLIYNEMFDCSGRYVNGEQFVVDAILDAADSCVGQSDLPIGINFEKKIVLSIAIRIRADRYMARRISDEKFVNSIVSNQTPRLVRKFEDVFPMEAKTIRVLKSVMLMTPENIHLNSFMYEPILDMSDEHLGDLYRQVQGLVLV